MDKAEPYVWHFVMTREGQPAARGERIATWSLPPADVQRLGLRRVRRAVDAERQVWARRIIAAGYVDGYGVSVVAERGYRRSIFPSAAVAAITPARSALILPSGTAGGSDA